MANIVDTDQTAPKQFDLGLHCLHMPFVRNFGVQNFRTFIVVLFLCSCSEDGHDSQSDDNMFQENITFGQLG